MIPWTLFVSCSNTKILRRGVKDDWSRRKTQLCQPLSDVWPPFPQKCGNNSFQTNESLRAKFLRLPFLSCDILYVLIITCSVYCNREETCFVTFSYRSAQIFITAPNIFHLGVEETISVILYNTDKPVNVTVIAQDFPDKKRNLSAANGVFARGKRLFIAKFTLFLFISNVKK